MKYFSSTTIPFLPRAELRDWVDMKDASTLSRSVLNADSCGLDSASELCRILAIFLFIYPISCVNAMTCLTCMLTHTLFTCRSDKRILVRFELDEARRWSAPALVMARWAGDWGGDRRIEWLLCRDIAAMLFVDQAKSVVTLVGEEWEEWKSIKGKKRCVIRPCWFCDVFHQHELSSHVLPNSLSCMHTLCLNKQYCIPIILLKQTWLLDHVT